MKEPIDLDLTAPERLYLERVAPEHKRVVIAIAITIPVLIVAEAPLLILLAGPALYVLIAVLDQLEYQRRRAAVFARVERRANGRPASSPLPDDPKESKSALIMFFVGLPLSTASWILYDLGIGDPVTMVASVLGGTLAVVGLIDPVRRFRALRP